MTTPKFTARDLANIRSTGRKLVAQQYDETYDGPEVIMTSIGYVEVYPEGDDDASVTMHGVNYTLEQLERASKRKIMKGRVVRRKRRAAKNGSSESLPALSAWEHEKSHSAPGRVNYEVDVTIGPDSYHFFITPRAGKRSFRGYSLDVYDGKRNFGLTRAGVEATGTNGTMFRTAASALVAARKAHALVLAGRPLYRQRKAKPEAMVETVAQHTASPNGRIPKMSGFSAIKRDKTFSVEHMEDDATGDDYGVFGGSTGFCYGTYSLRSDAEEKAAALRAGKARSSSPNGRSRLKRTKLACARRARATRKGSSKAASRLATHCPKRRSKKAK